jgi:hypothetical protein
LNQMPKEKPHLQFEKWAKEYGPIYSVMLGTKSMFVISSDHAVKELLDKKSANTSSRPALYTGEDLLSRGKRMVMMVNCLHIAKRPFTNATQTYGASWRTVRMTPEAAAH